MLVKQVAELVNNITQEISGEIALLNEDLTNVVDVGKSLQDAEGVENFMRKLPDHIGRIVFVNRAYNGWSPNVRMDGWEFGSILEKIRVVMPQAVENQAWELQDGASYDQQIFKATTAEAKFFNGKTTFEVDLSITEDQIKSAFSSANQLNGLIETIYNAVDKSMTVKIDGLVMRTINNMMGDTLNEGATTRAINLLANYKAINTDSTLTAETCLYDADFIRYAVMEIGYIKGLMTGMSTLFNMGGTDKFTPRDLQKTVLLDRFAKACGVYLYDAQGQFRIDNLSIGEFETVPYWQGTGTGATFDSISSINVTTATGNEVSKSGILATVFDLEALAVCNPIRKTKMAPYNAKGEFQNIFYKWECQYINDYNENMVVFYVADAE